MNCAYHGLNSSALSEIKPMDGLISKTFKNLYYTEPENRWLDGCAEKIFSSNLSDQQKPCICTPYFKPVYKKGHLICFTEVIFASDLTEK